MDDKLVKKLVDHILAMKDDSYLREHPEWYELVADAEAVVGLVEAQFTLFDEIENPTYYKGKHVPSVSWNGWACPYFDFSTARKILDDLKYDWEFDEPVFKFKHLEFDDEDTCKAEYVDEGRPLYPLGAYAWTWSVKE